MNKIDNKNPITSLHDRSLALHRIVIAASIVCALAVVVLFAGCGSTEPVCQGAPQHMVLVPSTSKSDLLIDRAQTPYVAQQVVDRTAASCGQLTAGIQNNLPEANLDLHTLWLASPIARAFNRSPEQRQLVARGVAFVKSKLLDPLKVTPATAGSPFLGALVKIGQELQAHGGSKATIVLVGDGIDLEPAPQGDGLINLAADPLEGPRVATVLKRMMEFVPLLKSLAGSCVMLVGAGATNVLPDTRIRLAQQLFGQVLRRAGVGFVATRSSDLPDCGAGS
jgi:hypothetical protein